MDREKIKEIIANALGETSALFMSQEKIGTQIIMPTKELENIAIEATLKIEEIWIQDNLTKGEV